MEEKTKKLEMMLREIYPNEDFIFGINNLVANDENKTDKLLEYINENKGRITLDHVSQLALELDLGITNKHKLEKRLRKIHDDNEFVCCVLSHMVTEELTVGLINHIDNHPELTSKEIISLSIEAHKYAIDNDLITNS